MTKELLQFTWFDFDRAVDALVMLMQQYPKCDGVYGIPRGGLVLAVALSHRLGIPFKDSVTPKTLVVDDISETGAALHPFADNFKATIHYVRGSKVCPNIYIAMKEPNTWIVYPWETSISSQGEKRD